MCFSDDSSHTHKYLECATILVAGLASGFVFAPWSHTWWLSLPLLVSSFGWLIHTLPPPPFWKLGWWRGWWFGWGHFIVSCHWITYAFLQAPKVPQGLVIIPLFLLPALLAIFIAVATAIATLSSDNSVHRGLILVVTWPVMEWVRGWLFTGFPWNLLSYSWGGLPPMMQSVALWGPYGLSLWTLFIVLCFSKNMTQHSPYDNLRWCGGIVLACLYLWGWGRLEPIHFHEVYALRIVQTNGLQTYRFTPEGRSAMFKRTQWLSQQSSRLNITHLIWPEGALPFTLPSKPPPCFVTPQAIYKILLCGGRRSHDHLMWNTLWAFDAQGSCLGFCDKKHLVPFGEYIPYEKLLKSMGIFPRLLGGSYRYFSSGITSRLLALPQTPNVSILICYEDIFPGLITLDQRGAWILNITQDAWFGSSVGPEQHLEISRFRAIELGLPLVRASDVGPSALIDAYGRVMSKLSCQEGVLDIRLPQELPAPPYAIQGNHLFWLLILLWLGIIAEVLRRSRQN